MADGEDAGFSLPRAHRPERAATHLHDELDAVLALERLEVAQVAEGHDARAGGVRSGLGELALGDVLAEQTVDLAQSWTVRARRTSEAEEGQL